MPKKVGTTNWRKKRKMEHLEKIEYRYYIFCEGEQTEPNYFKKFKEYITSNSIYKDLVLIEIEPCAADTLRVLEKAQEYIKTNDISKGHIWCVYDKDSFPAQNFNNVVQKINQINLAESDLHYHAAWSNECIEFWFILHFEYYTSNNHRTDYIKFLNERFSNLRIGKYAKNMDSIFDILIKYGNPKLAIKRARKIVNDSANQTPSYIAPGTKVYELVEELAKYLPLDLREKII